MERKDILRRLEERLARGEISEATYLGIKARYAAEPEEAVSPETAVPSFGPEIGETIARATEVAARATGEAMRAVGGAFRGMEISGIGVKLSDEVIKVAGSGVVSGQPVRTREFKAAGSARVRGDLDAETTKVAGACAFEGNVRTDTFHASGSVRVDGSVTADEFEASGSVHVGKDLTADSVVASGSLRVEGQIKCDSFSLAGSVKAEGLAADSVSMELSGNSSVRWIRADSVSVKATGGFLRSRGDLTAERIEGDSVYLEGTVAGLVVGDRVRIGPHCRVSAVESDDLIVHESSEVAERRTRGA